MERIAIYPGSFDPITTGHMDIIRRAAVLFDRVVVAVLHNPVKTGFFTEGERLQMIADCCRELPNVTVDSFDGMSVDYAMQQGACALIRGLRNASDFQSELVLSQINRKLAPGVDTVFLMCEPYHSIVSSSAVRELLTFGGSLEDFVPQEIMERVMTKARK